MKQFLLMLMLLTSFCGAAQAQTYGDAQTDPTKQGVIVTPPTGTERHYYLDLLNDDPYDGWSWLDGREPYRHDSGVRSGQ